MHIEICKSNGIFAGVSACFIAAKLLLKIARVENKIEVLLYSHYDIM